MISSELVIPSYNRISTLEKTLQNIRVLYPELQICLGLQGDVPDSFRRKVASDHRMRMILMSEPGTTPALNKCIASSDAEIILILDDDAVPSFGWLEAHLAAFVADPGLPYSTGREIRSSRDRNAFSEWIRITAEFFFGIFLGKEKKLNGRIVGWTNRLGLIFGNFDQPGTCLINSPRGCNMAVNKVSFLQIGGFEKSFRGNAWGFEAEFGIRFAKARKYGRYIGNAIVVHHEVASGGSRNANHRQWYSDFVHNHRLLIAHIGPQGWFGSLPRLVKRGIRYFSTR